MDANTIRLILIVVGAILILLMYLWERRHEREEGYEDAYDDDIGLEDIDDSPYGVRAEKRSVDRAARIQADEDAEFARAEPVFDTGREIDSDAAYREDSFQDALEDSAPASGIPSLEPLLLQVSVSARRYPFRGPALLQAAESCGLYPGDMGIFHSLEDSDEESTPYFSMANMVKPGTFPFDAMDSFSTPGLMLFAQLEGNPEDMTVLDEMIVTARKLAQALEGEVLDDRRSPLTVRKEEEMRQSVVDNGIRWAKALLR